MIVIGVHISARMLTDVGRRSFYARVILFNQEVWVQWWPRHEPGNRLTCGFTNRGG